MAVATDLGYMPPNVKLALQRVDVLLLESNHDLEMLKDGPYPWSVKQRVLSRVGHLSNHATAEFLAHDYDGGATYIVLGHLSEQNNAPELALFAAEQAIGGRMSLLGNHILLAKQSVPLALHPAFSSLAFPLCDRGHSAGIPLASNMLHISHKATFPRIRAIKSSRMMSIALW